MPDASGDLTFTKVADAPSSAASGETPAAPDGAGGVTFTKVADAPAVPFPEDQPGTTYGNILPFARDASGKMSLAVPEMIRSPLRGMISAGKKLTGQEPVDFGALQSTEGQKNPVSPDEQAALLSAGGVRSPAAGRAGAVTGTADVPPNLSVETEIRQAAMEKILKRMADDTKGGGPTTEEIMGRLDAGRAAGKPVTIADVAGENVRSLAGNVARQPGPARNFTKDFIEKRDEGAGLRLSGDIEKHVASGSMWQTAEDLLTQRSERARPLYSALEHLKFVWSPRLQAFLEDPALQTGMNKGYELERLHSLAKGEKFDPTSLGLDLDKDGNVTFVKVPNMRVLDMAKRGMDAVIADERDPITGRLSARGIAFDQVRKAYLDEIEKADPTGAYKAARDAWAGPSASFDALRSGRTIFSRPPEEIAGEFAKLSDNDKQFYKLGVADMLKERIGKTAINGDEAKAVINNDWTRRQLRPLFDSDQSFQKFIDSVTAERQMFTTKFDVLKGSQTAAREAEDRTSDMKMGLDAAHGVAHAVSGNHLAATAKLLQVYRQYKDLGLRPNPALNEAIARMLLDPNAKLTKDAIETGSTAAVPVSPPSGPVTSALSPPPAP